MIEIATCECARAQQGKESRGVPKQEYDFSYDNIQRILRTVEWNELQFEVPEVAYTTFNFPYWLKAA